MFNLIYQKEMVPLNIQVQIFKLVILLLAVPRRLFCFGSLVVLDVFFRYLSLFLLYINIKIGKNRC